MKSLLLLITAALFNLSAFSQNTISEKERKFAIDHLKQTKADLIESVKGLSEAQLKYKTAPERWSVEDCVKHIAMSEMGVWQMIEGNLKQPATPEKRSEVKATDDQVIKMISDRSTKFQAPEQMQPQNTPYKNLDEALASFTASRDKLIEYLKNTKDDLRNHVVDFPAGKMDAYQMILLISAHSNRHTQQLKEVMADAGYPK